MPTQLSRVIVTQGADVNYFCLVSDFRDGGLKPSCKHKVKRNREIDLNVVIDIKVMVYKCYKYIYCIRL